jgi:hypothetical protein
MLSKKEREYLQGNLNPSKNYEHKLIFSIKKKLNILYDVDFPLITKQRDNMSSLSRQLLGKLTSYQTKLIPLKICFNNYD